MDDSCPVLLKRAQSFWGKSRKCEKKITQGQTDAQQNINRKARSLVLWLRWIEWKNRRGNKFEVKGYVAMLIVHRRQQYGNALWKKNQAIFQSALNLKPIQTTLKKIFFLSGHINAIWKNIYMCMNHKFWCSIFNWLVIWGFITTNKYDSPTWITGRGQSNMQFSIMFVFSNRHM